MNIDRNLNTTNITYMDEENYSILCDSTDVWDGSLPFDTGSVFPTEEIKERARISKTNKMIYNNEVDMIFNNILSVFPEIDPTYGWQIKEIITHIPYFKNTVNAWVGLIAGEEPIIDIDSKDGDKLMSIIETTNFANFFQNEVRSRFMDVISAYRIDKDLKGGVVITPIEAKNLICFANKDIPGYIEVVVVFSIYKGELGKEYVDFVEYYENGKIKKSTFEYANGVLGELVDSIEDVAFGGEFNESPIIVFRHNTVGNEIYGVDQFRYWSPSMLAGMREFQNVLRLGERTREMIRKVPESAIKKSSIDGSSSFFNKGTIGYNHTPDGKSPDIEYIVPEIRMSEIKDALDEAIMQIALDTQLGISYFNIDKLGSSLSGESIRAALFPARIEANRVTTEMRPFIKELVIKLGYAVGVDIHESKISIRNFDGFPKDTKDDVEAIHMRLDAADPSITLKDAVMSLDHLSSSMAENKVREIKAEMAEFAAFKKSKEQVVNVDNTKNTTLELDNNKDGDEEVYSSLSPSGGVGVTKEDKFEYKDDTVWQTEFARTPRDIIPQGG